MTREELSWIIDKHGDYFTTDDLNVVVQNILILHQRELDLARANVIEECAKAMCPKCAADEAFGLCENPYTRDRTYRHPSGACEALAIRRLTQPVSVENSQTKREKGE